MGVASNSSFGPPPLATPISGSGPDQIGIPYQLRDIPSGSLNVNWAAWFNSLFARVLLSPPFLSSLQADLSGLAASLTGADAGLLVNVTDYSHVLQWTGSAWQWGPGDIGSGMFALFEIDPGTGWHLYDGTANVPYLKSDGTLGAVTLPDLVSAANKAAYAKAGTPNGGPNAATAPGITGTTATGTAAIAGSTASGTANIGNDNGIPGITTPGIGLNVPAEPHTHIDAGHTHGLGSIADAGHTHGFGSIAADAVGQPRNLVRRPFFRQ